MSSSITTPDPYAYPTSAPLVPAMLIQLACLPVLWGVCQTVWPSLSVAHAALLQGGLAMLGARMMRLPSWWLFIQFVLPPLLLLALAGGLPPTIYLLGFVLLLLMFWSGSRRRAPLLPSGAVAWNAVLAVLPTTGSAPTPFRMIDIGSGMGGFCLHVARHRPALQVSGIEIAPLPWLISRLRAWHSGRPVRFVRGDYHALPLADFDLVFAYLSPAAMPALWHKAKREMRGNSLLLSYQFTVHDTHPDLAIDCGSGRLLYGWRM